MAPADIVKEVTESGLRGRGGAGFPTGIKWKTVLDTERAIQKYIVCNADEGDSGTFSDRMIMEGDPFVLIEGMAIAGSRRRRDQGLRLYPLRISARDRDDERSDPRGAAGRRARRKRRSAPSIPSTWRCGSAPAPMSAAKRRRCSKASKASAARCAPNRRCPRTRACSASRPSSTTSSRSPPCRSSSTGAAPSTSDFGMGRSRGTIPIQIAGNVRHGGLFEAAFGLTLGEIVDDIGGGTGRGGR